MLRLKTGRHAQNIPCSVLGSSQRFVENDSHEPKKLAENDQHNFDTQNVTIEGKMQTKITAEVRKKRQPLNEYIFDFKGL